MARDPAMAQEAAANQGLAGTAAPAAMPQPGRDSSRLGDLSLDRICHHCRLLGGRLRRLMRHDLLPLAVAPSAPRVREASRPRALVAPARLENAIAPRLLAALHAAVALSAVAAAAHQHLVLATSARVSPCQPTRGGAACPGSRQRQVAPPAPVAPAPGEVAVLKRWTKSVRRCNTCGALCSTRWGRGGVSNCQVVRLPRPF